MMKYKVVLADPPWKYGDKLRMSDTARGSDDQYATMTPKKIAELSHIIDITNHAGTGKEVAHYIADYRIEDDAVLFMWATNAFVLDGTTQNVCRAWGFEPKQLFTWIKTKDEYTVLAGVLADQETNAGEVEEMNQKGLQFGMGRCFRNVTEQLIVATRPGYSKNVKSHSERSALFSPRRLHSQKPEEMYDIIERLFDGPYLELFARERRPGWTSWGLELEPNSKP